MATVRSGSESKGVCNMRLEIEDQNTYEEYPGEWLTEALRPFFRAGKSALVGTIWVSGNADEWEIIGRMLLDELVFSHEYVMAVIDGDFMMHKTIEQWVKHMRQPFICSESSFSYGGYIFETPKSPLDKSQYVMWSSVTSRRVSPFGPDFFSQIPPYIPIGCDILVAAPKIGVSNDVVNSFAERPGADFIFDNMGSWLSPMEDRLAYHYGVLEDEPGWNTVFNQGWLEEKLRSHLVRK